MSFNAPPPPPTGPQPMSAADEQTWSLLSHVGPLLISVISVPGFLFPLIVMFMKGKQSARVQAQAKEALNFQLNVLLYAVVLLAAAFAGGILSVVESSEVGITTTVAVLIFALLALVVVSFVMPIVAAARIASNKEFRYPLILRFVK